MQTAGASAESRRSSHVVDGARDCRRRHYQFIALAPLVFVLAFCLEVLPDQKHVALRGFQDYPLPHVCASRTWLGVNCPACGLTRSLIHLSHGDWAASVSAHRLGWLVAALIAAQAPYRLLALRFSHAPALNRWLCWVVALGLIGLFVGSWLFDLAFRPESLRTGEPNWLRPR